MRVWKTCKSKSNNKKNYNDKLPNQERVGRLGEKENYKYSRILEADTIKQEEMKKKLKWVS